MTLDLIFLLMLYSLEDVSFNIILLNVLEGIKKVSLVNAVQEIPTRNTV